ncbi:30081_t:CDS:2, partial [Gigaspora margarita]
AQKTEIWRLKLKGISQIKLAKQFGIAEATISGIVREKEKWLALDLNSTNAYLKRQRPEKFFLLEEALALWISRANTALQTVTGAIIQRKATQLAEALEVIGFNASDGWLSRFKKWHHIKEYKRLGKGASAPLEDLPRFHSELQEINKKYKPENVYNADETGHLDSQMQLARCLILLIVDGASTHALEKGFTPTNVNLHFFPLRTTAHLQLCDAGIIWSFKDRIEAFDFYLEFGNPSEELTIKDAIDFTTSAWKKVTS